MKTVCLIGKPNVGKSSIFNRLIKEKKSIILNDPGITRDRIYGIVNYNNKKFNIIDTGGIHGNNNLDNDILIQVEIAIEEADTILFVVDGLLSLNESDFKIRNMLKKSGKEVIVLVNKIDNEQRKNNIYEYYELGFENVIGVSAEHNIGFDILLEKLTQNILEEEVLEDKILKFCLIGRPNVGKSSLINALLNEDRVIVSDIPFTTRDAIDTKFKYYNKEYIAIDTAGIRKKAKILKNIEKYSLLRSLKAIERSDVCVLVVDASVGVIEFDKHILSYALEEGKGIVIAINKWDLIKNKDVEIKKWQEELNKEFNFVSFVNCVFISAITKKGLDKLIQEINNAYENNNKSIKTSALNDVIEKAVYLHEPPSYKGKRLKIYFGSQTGIRPPKFTLQVNNKNLVHFSYERYLKNKIREAFDLSGTPIILQFKNKNE